jgi:hypothetical protein
MVGSRGGIRTPDRVVNSHLLCQLSYPGIVFFYIKNKYILSNKRQLSTDCHHEFKDGLIIDTLAKSGISWWLIPKAIGTLPAELPGNSLFL